MLKRWYPKKGVAGEVGGEGGGGEAYPSAVMRYTSIIKYRFPLNWTGSSKRV